LREKEYIKNQYAAILSSIGVIMLLSSGVVLLPLLILFLYPQESVNAWAFMLPAIYLGLPGLILWKSFRHHGVTLSIPEGGVIVLISWSVVIMISSLPFIYLMNMTFSRAIFESMSGWTTTGLSVVDVTKAPRLILTWRSIIQLSGGAGLAIIMMSAIVGPTGVGISNAEGRGDQLVPHVRQSSRLVIMIYLGYAATGIIAYKLAGMSLFDAINHSFPAVSTGGFSTQPENIGHWDCFKIEAVSIPLMILGNLSFVTAYYLWRGKLGAVVRNGEVRLMAVILPVSALTVFIFTCQGIYPHLTKSMRVAVFETVSCLTTTGFQTVSYGNWNGTGIFILILLMLIGGGTCSTAGGIKQFRVYMMWKLFLWELKRLLLPGTAVVECPIWEGDRKSFVDDTKIRQACVFLFMYLTTYILGTLVLCICGYPLKDSLFEFASAIGTVGTSVGVTSYKMPDAALWAEILGMFFGRLEFMVIFISLIKIGKDSRVMLLKKIR
jgi:trk system potassium uptake protein TrkH